MNSLPVIQPGGAGPTDAPIVLENVAGLQAEVRRLAQERDRTHRGAIGHDREYDLALFGDRARRVDAHWLVKPPSIGSDTPVIMEAPSLSRKTIRAAISAPIPDESVSSWTITRRLVFSTEAAMAS